MLDPLDLDALATLAPPDVLEETTFQEIYQASLEAFKILEPTYGLLLDSDPAVKVLQVMCYREFLVRQRINEAIRSTLLVYANGTYLDHLASFYDVAREVDEEDDALRGRIVTAIRGRSVAGSEYYYVSEVLKSTTDAVNAAAYRTPGSPTVTIAVEVAVGADTAATIATVLAHVSSDPVRVVSDVVEVREAQLPTQDVELEIVLIEGAVAPDNTEMATYLSMKWLAERSFGTDMTHDWLIAAMHETGYVYSTKVISPATTLVAAPYDLVGLGTVTVTVTGANL